MEKELKYIFGLTRGQVSVNGAGIMDDSENTFTFNPIVAKDLINRSDSGLYLDELTDLPLNKIPAELDPQTGLPIPGSLWDMANTARINAIQELRSSLMVGLRSLYRMRNEPYVGLLGSNTTQGIFDFADQEIVVTRIATANKPGHIAKITAIGLHTSLPVVVPIMINDTLYQVPCSPNLKFFTLPRPLLIPLNGQDIVISYRVDGFLVGDNKMCFTCGNKAAEVTPYFPQIQFQRVNGLVMDLTLTCVPDNVIVQNYLDDRDIENNLGPVAVVMAYATRFKAASLLVDQILNSTQINRYTMLEQNPLTGKRNHFEKEFQFRVNWLIGSTGLNLEADNCYMCRPTDGVVKRGIHVT